MKLPALALLALLAVPAADAQPLPVGSGLIAFEEKLGAGRDCDSFSEAGMLVLSIFPNGSFRAEIDAGVFTGSVRPVDPKGRAWHLRFDGPSLQFFRLYLEAGVRVLCGRDAPIESGGVETFVLKLGKRGSHASLRLSASGRSPALGKARARHLLKGKGPWAIGLLPAPAPTGAGGTITLVPPNRSGGAILTVLRLDAGDTAADPAASAAEP